MSSTLTAMLSVGNTQHVHPCVTNYRMVDSQSPNLQAAFFRFSWNVLCTFCPSPLVTPPEQVSTV